ncbi:MAG: hypothetical protein JW963_03415 [Anaerolineales bacterium]|nr:hypothetical protein [Anaerolineales bacterium]
MRIYIKLTLMTIFALALSACGSASIPTEENASAMEATAIAEIVSTTFTQTAVARAEQLPVETDISAATLTSDYENAAPIQTQLIIGIYMLEGSGQAITAAQASALLPLLTPLKDISNSNNTISQEQIDTLMAQAVSVLTTEQIQAIVAMQVTQETIMSAMQQLEVWAVPDGVTAMLRPAV